MPWRVECPNNLYFSSGWLLQLDICTQNCLRNSTIKEVYYGRYYGFATGLRKLPSLRSESSFFRRERTVNPHTIARQDKTQAVLSAVTL